MVAPVIVNSVIAGSIVMILCIGFTFTYMIEKFPNFAHISYASVGTMTAFYLVRFHGLNPYLTWPVSTLTGGIIGVLLYLGVVKPIKGHGFREITLTFTFYIISRIIGSLLAIFSYWLLMGTGTQSNGFLLKNFDFELGGLPGIGVVAPATLLVLVALMNVFLYRAKFGIAMRATTEDEQLAAGLGINVSMVHVSSWFISGALSALAGAIIPMWRATSVDFDDGLLVTVMAGSVIGGLTSINGAIVGGFLMASIQKLLTYHLMSAFGVWMGSYEGLLPIVFLFLVLALEPNGLSAIKIGEVSATSLRQALRRLGRSLRSLLNFE